MKKKIACAVLGAMLLGLSLTACGNADNPSTGEITESGYPKREFIVAAIDSHDKTSAHEIEIFTNLVTERFRRRHYIQGLLRQSAGQSHRQPEYAQLRNCRPGYGVHPLYAQQPAFVADHLLRALCP